MTGDKSPYGVMDMAGNVSEWTGTVEHRGQLDYPDRARRQFRLRQRSRSRAASTNWPTSNTRTASVSARCRTPPPARQVNGILPDPLAMTSPSVPRRACACCRRVVVHLAGVRRPGSARGRAAAQLVVRHLAARRTYMLYEPLVATVTLTNQAGRDVTLEDAGHQAVVQRRGHDARRAGHPALRPALPSQPADDPRRPDAQA